MSITLDTTAHLARLARIQLSEQEISHLTQDMQSILHFIEQVMTVDLSRIDSTLPSGRLDKMPLDDDEVREGGHADVILSNAPQTACGMFAVPKMVE